jgi:hypothetical protein
LWHFPSSSVQKHEATRNADQTRPWGEVSASSPYAKVAQ